MTQFPNCSIWKVPPGVLVTQFPDCSIWKVMLLSTPAMDLRASQWRLMVPPRVLVTQFPHCST